MGDFVKIYTQLAEGDKADGIVSVLVSSKLSSTYKEARLVSKEAGL
jgi:fatty acid-binding protein DegV